MISKRVLKVISLFLIATLLTATFTACGKTIETKATEPSVRYVYDKDKVVKVGVAWVTDKEDQADVLITRISNELGAEAVILPQIKDYGLEYDGSEISAFFVNANGEIDEEIVK